MDKIVLLAELARLRAALKPFADLARGVPENWPGECVLIEEYVPSHPVRFDTRLNYLPAGDGFGPTINQWRAAAELLTRTDGAA